MKHLSRSIHLVTLLLVSCGLLAFILVLSSCTNKPKAGPPPTPPPQEVGVITLQPEKVTLISELPGRTAAFRVAEVRPQVGGILQKRLFTEGRDVKAGEQLYQIDAAPYKAAQDSARAALDRAEAILASTKLTADRYKSLAPENAISKQDLDLAVAAQAQAEADVAASKAALETAFINLLYTKVQAPLNGRIGRSTITEGALVTPGQATPLATIQQIDPIYVDVTRSSIEMLRLKNELAAGKIKQDEKGATNVRLVLEDGSEYDQPGKLEFTEISVDPGTGSVTIRAIFPNPQHQLLPGMFVHARVEEGTDEQAILVPQEAVTHNFKGDPTLLVVNQEQKVEQRKLKTDRTIGNRWLVTEGVQAGERVIVEGLQKTGQGATVHAVEAKPSSPPEAAGGGTSVSVETSTKSKE